MPSSLPQIRRPVALIVLDGFGLNPDPENNAVAMARKPNLDRFLAEYPHSKLSASGEDVGLSPGQMGDSNVGHLNLGAGRVVYQLLVRINRSIRNGTFFKNPVWLEVMDAAVRNGRALHLMGLLSDGGVHSHIDHLFALIDLARARGVKDLYVHCFLDGRDVPPASALTYINTLETKLKESGIGAIATVSGRYYAMDRDKRWERTERAYRALVLGEGLTAPSAREAVEKSYKRDETDEFVQPTVIVRNGEPVGRIRPGDSVIFYNYRADRARQISWALTQENFEGFDRPGGYLGIQMASMAQYDEDLPIPKAFPPEVLDNTLGEIISKHGLRQLRIAETEKYAHVTYFFNGGEEKVFPGEDRQLIPSPKVATYDQKPEMSAYEVTEALLQQIASDKYDFIVLNYANPDMVGHTGDLKAAIKAVEVVDDCLGRVIEAIREKDGAAMIIGDHGNCDQMVDPETGEPHTNHTLNPVPCILIDDRRRGAKLNDGFLASVAPTLLEIIGLPVPPEMDQPSLIVRDLK